MSKKVKNVSVVNKISTAVSTTKTAAKKANEFALNTTEGVVLETISIAGQWQKVTDKALKGGLKLMANQQDLVFNSLDLFKSQLIQGKKRVTKLFA